MHFGILRPPGGRGGGTNNIFTNCTLNAFSPPQQPFYLPSKFSSQTSNFSSRIFFPNLQSFCLIQNLSQVQGISTWTFYPFFFLPLRTFPRICKCYLYIRNLTYALFNTICRQHFIYLVFSTCQHKYKWILCTENRF